MRLRKLVGLLLAVALLSSAGMTRAAAGRAGRAGSPPKADPPGLAQPDYTGALTQYGVLGSDPVGRSDQPITLLEVLVLTARAVGLEQQALALQAGSPFTDVYGKAAGYAALAAERGWVRPAEPARFGSQPPVTAPLALSVLEMALGVPVELEYNCDADAMTIAAAVKAGLVTEADPVLKDLSRPIQRIEFYALLQHAIFTRPLASGRTPAQIFLDSKLPYILFNGGPAQNGVYTMQGMTEHTVWVAFDGTQIALSGDNTFTITFPAAQGDTHLLEARNSLGSRVLLHLQIGRDTVAFQQGPSCGDQVWLFGTLDKVVRAVLGKSTGNLTVCDLERLITLRAPSKGIDNISGHLAKAANLVELDLSGNNLSGVDLTPLAKLPSLHRLDLSHAQITNLDWLAGMTNLTELNLSGNSLADISPLAGLTELQHLYLADNRISDLTPLAGLTKLWDLDLAGNEVANLGPLVENFAHDRTSCGKYAGALYVNGNRLNLADEATQGQLAALLADRLLIRAAPQKQ